MKVTVAIPFYNAGKFFKLAIESVLQQTFTDFELILINDGSSDDSLAVAQSFNDPRVSVVDDGKNKGLPARLNEIIDLAQGEFIARMDADDIICPTKLATQLAFLEKHNDLDIVTTGTCSITNENEVFGYRHYGHLSNIEPTSLSCILGGSGISHATILARKDWYQRNRYNENAKLMEDYQLWIDASIKNDLKVGYLTDYSYFYREESSVSSEKAINAYKNQMKIIKANYTTYLTGWQLSKFLMSMRAKIVLVYLMDKLSLSHKLLNIRNRKTNQNDEVKSMLQSQVDRMVADYE